MAQFKNSEHEERYYTVLSKMKSTDSYHRAVAYLFTLDKDCSRHIDDVFDFRGDAIKPDGLNCGWQTSTSIRTTRLAFTPDDIFTSTYAKHYFEAIKLRYPEHDY